MDQQKVNCKHRRRLSAKGWLLFPLALRPRLAKLEVIFGANADAKSGRAVLGRMVVGLLVALSACGSALAGLAVPLNVSAASLTLTVPSSLSLDISPSRDGTFVKSDPGKISVSTDNSSGYTLSIKAKNSENSNDLLNGSNKLLSISSNLTEDQYKGAGNLNTWGYLPSKLNSTINTSFLPGPTAEETILDKTEDAGGDNNNYDLTLAAKVDNSIAAGSYANTFILSVSANTPKTDGTMQTWHGCGSLQDGQIATLRDERDDSTYRVAKLADGKCWMIDNLKIVDKEISSEDSDMASGNFAIPASSIDGFDGSNYDGDWAYYGGLKDDQGNDYGAHYSWHVATAGTGTQSMSSGDATSSICPKGWRLPKGGANGDFAALDKAMGGTGSNRTDATARDRFIKKPIPGFTYAGYVYNSSLGNQGSYGYYWSSTAYVTSGAYYLYFGTGGYIGPQVSNGKYNGFSVRCVARETMQTVEDWGPNVQEGETVTAIDERDGSTYTVSRLKDGKLWMTQNLRIIDKKLTPEDSDVSSDYTLPGSDLSVFNNTNDLTAVYYNNDTTNGAYYTWRAATADTGRYSTSSGDATSSICPKGWRLPTGGDNGEFQQLYNQYNSRVLMTNTAGPHFILAGRVVSSSLNDVGSGGGYWSSTADGPALAYDLSFNSSNGNVYPADYYGKYYGLSVRCVAREKTMQTVNEWGSNVKTGDIVTAKDERDGSTYRVARLDDGQLWTIDNLKIVNKKITPADSDVSSDFTIPASNISGFSSSNYNGDWAYYGKTKDSSGDDYGAHYSWHVATAGTGTQSMSSGDATSSICPKGWRLPKGGANGDFQKLYDSGYNDISKLTAKPIPGFTYAGDVGNSSLGDQGSYGYYWSSTAGSTYNAYDLLFASYGYIDPQSLTNKCYGFSVRCIARE